MNALRYHLAERSQSRKLFIVGVVFVVLAAACAAPAPPTPTPAPTPVPTPGPLDLVEVFQDAYNQQDADRIVALLSDEPSWSHGLPTLTGVGVNEVRNFVEFQFAFDSHIEFSSCTMVNGVVACQAVVTDDCLPPEGGARHYDMRFAFTDDKISLVYSQFSDSADPVANYDFVYDVMGWASVYRPADNAVLFLLGDEWNKFTHADQAGDVTAFELGQAWDRACHGYAGTSD